MTAAHGQIDLSIVLPVHNEEAILDANVLAIERHVAGLASIGAFEILLVCNGCVDRSEPICAALAAARPGRIRALTLTTRGLGYAIRAGIEAAAHDAVMFYAVDLPFGLQVIDDSIRARLAEAGAIVIGSKGHPASRVARSVPRRLFSAAISVINNVVFQLDIRDTQGSMLFPKALLDRYGGAMDSPGAFFQAQIAIYGHLMGCRIVEIPVTLKETEARTTRFSLVRDGLAYIRAINRERHKLKAAAGTSL